MKEYRETEEKTEEIETGDLSREELEAIEKGLDQAIEAQLSAFSPEPPKETPEEVPTEEADPEEELPPPAEGFPKAAPEEDPGEAAPGEDLGEALTEGEEDSEEGFSDEAASALTREEEAAVSSSPRERRALRPRRDPRERPGKKAGEAFRGGLKAAGRLLRRFLKSRWFRYIVVLLAVLALVLLTAHTIRNWKYRSCEVTEADTQADTTSFHYCALGEYVLRYGLDSAMLTDRDGGSVWTVSYSMQSPALAVCGETAAIYDRSGTSIVVCDASGQIGSVSTELPIQKATVAEQGVVAAILEDESSTWIRYYDQQGALIASFRTAMDASGYPLDISLSSNGLLLGVSYLKMENGVPGTELDFYNFGNAGQIQMDNQVSSFTYEDALIPEVAYLDSDTCVAFRENGFAVFEGGQIPERIREVTVEQEIVSIFWDESHIGLILENDDPEYPFLLTLYGPSGKQLFQEALDYEYENAEMGAGQIILSNRTGFCAYSDYGVEKFRGELSGRIVRDLFAVGKTRFLLVAEDGLYTIKIK